MTEIKVYCKTLRITNLSENDDDVRRMNGFIEGGIAALLIRAGQDLKNFSILHLSIVHASTGLDTFLLIVTLIAKKT